MIDTPQNSTGGNFATLNPLFKYRGGGNVINVNTYSEGNTKLACSAGYGWAVGTMAPEAGKWYYEIAGITNNQTTIGAWEMDALYDSYSTFSSQKNYRYFGNNGIVYNKDGGTVTTYSTYTIGDVIGCALDLDNNKIYFSKNGTWQGSSDPAAGTNPTATDVTGAWFPACTADGSQSVKINFGQDSSFSGSETAQGNTDANAIGDFYYTPPTGFLALCSDNLPDPSVALPEENFKPIIWSGTGGSRDYTDVGFQPDLVWQKARDDTWQWNVTDSVRGVGKSLMIDAPSAQDTNSANGYIDAFLSNVFLLLQVLQTITGGMTLQILLSHGAGRLVEHQQQLTLLVLEMYQRLVV